MGPMESDQASPDNFSWRRRGSAQQCPRQLISWHRRMLRFWGRSDDVFASTGRLIVFDDRLLHVRHIIEDGAVFFWKDVERCGSNRRFQGYLIPQLSAYRTPLNPGIHDLVDDGVILEIYGSAEHLEARGGTSSLPVIQHVDPDMNIGSLIQLVEEARILQKLRIRIHIDDRLAGELLKHLLEEGGFVLHPQIPIPKFRNRLDEIWKIESLK